MFIATPTHLLVMEMDFKSELSPAIRHYSNKVESVNDITFGDISSIAINSEKNYLYVADSFYNKVYLYTIENFTSNNVVMRKRGKIMIKSLGSGTGNLGSRDKFNKPTVVRVGDDHKVYVMDSGNNCIKVYDENLNWLKTISKKSDFSSEQIVDIAIDKKTGYVYALNKKGHLFHYDNTQRSTLVKKYELMADYDDTMDQKEYKSITFSRDEPDMVYITNESDVVKKWKTNLSSRIGFYNLKELGATDITLSNLKLYEGNSAESDMVFLYGVQVDYKRCGRILKMFDKNYAFDFKQIQTKPEEFITNLTINKALLKLQYNHSLLTTNLHSTYTGVYDTEGKGIYTQLTNLAGYRADVYSYDIAPEEMVGINEPVLAGVINRPLKQLHNYQKKILTSI
jgi:hypothetical protein